MNKLALILAALLLTTFVGCSTADNPVGPDTADEIETVDVAHKPGDPHEPPSDPTDGSLRPDDAGKP